MKTDYHIVSFSGGKDSTAMLLRMIEEKAKHTQCNLMMFGGDE